MKQEAQVHMLKVTDNKISLFGYIKRGNSLHIFTNGEYPYNHLDNLAVPQHLYITVSQKVEPIKEGDWYIDDSDEIRQSMTDDADYWEVRSDYRKIIATTDNNLFTDEDIIPHTSLPMIPQPFIEEYCNRGGIDKVLVEYENIWCKNTERNIPTKEDIKFKLVSKEDHTINITLFKTNFCYDDITHAVAYGHSAARQGLSHEQTLLNYKEANNIKYIKESKLAITC